MKDVITKQRHLSLAGHKPRISPVMWLLIVFTFFVKQCIRYKTYRKTSNIRRTFAGNEIVDHSDVVGASPIGAAPTTSSFLT